MKNIQKILRVGVVFVLFALFTSCGSMKGVSPSGDLYGYVNGENINISNLPSPKTHTLVYGGLGVELDGEFTVSTKIGIGGHILRTSFMQLNQRKKAMIIEPIHLEDSICFLPMTPGLHVKLVQAHNYAGNTSMYYQHGIQGGGISFVTKKPGLQYIGGHIFTFDMSEPYKKYKKYKEIKVLRAMQVMFKNTEWLPLIEARIVELGYPKEGNNEK